MNWDQMEEALLAEFDELRARRLKEEFEEPWQQARWTLRQEFLHQKALETALEKRLSTGRWPEGLTAIQRWLLARRIAASLDAIAALSAWGAHEAPNVEFVLKALAVQQWPHLRYLTHLSAAVAALTASVPDPFEEGPPPQWAQ